MLVGSLAPPAVGVARADHDMAMSEGHGGSDLSVGLSLEAAEFETALYVGSYQGVAPSVGWMHGALGARATVGLYHLIENGLGTYGVGDAMVAGHATVVATDMLQAGVALHVMWPTGSETAGLGMGHVMAVPSVWATWRSSPVTLSASGGYGRALTALGGHDHGPMPLVDPMNLQELTWSAGADLDVGHGIRVGGRTFGALPIGTGVTRVIGAGRVAWGTPRVTTAFELQLGVTGDPFTIRGVVDTALRF
jgi:hypothetical protein